MQIRYRAGIITFLIGCLLSINALAEATLPKGIMKLDGKPAPELKLKNMDGDPFDLSLKKGKWIFVHFWAAWCGPCRKEMPTIQAILPKIDDTKLEIVLINTAESEDIVFSFLGGVAPDLNPLMDTDGLVTEVWQPRGLPATFFVDPQGNLQFLALGGRAWDEPDYFNFLQQLIKK